MAIRRNDGIKSYLELVKGISNNRGSYGFFQGMGVNSVGIIIYKGFGFMFYENIYSNIQNNGLIRNKYISEAIAAPIGSAIGQFIAYPFDMLKRNFMVSNEKLSLIQMANKIMAENRGFRGIYKGFTINLLKNPVSNGISFTVKRFLNDNARPSAN